MLQDEPVVLQPLNEGTNVPETPYEFMGENGIFTEPVQNPTDIFPDH